MTGYNPGEFLKLTWTLLSWYLILVYGQMQASMKKSFLWDPHAEVRKPTEHFAEATEKKANFNFV